MLYGYGILNNHVPTLKATVMKIGAAISTLLTSLYAVYKASSIVTTLNTSISRVYNGDNVNDTSGNAQNGTNVNEVTFTSGKVGNAFTFNGSNYISLPNNSLNLSDSGSNAFSISLWGYLTNTGQATGLLTNFMQNDPGTILNGWMLWHSGEKIRFNRCDGTSTSASALDTGTTLIAMNSWHHIVVTRKNGSTKIYVDNVLRASDTSTTSIVYTTTHKPLIGARNSYNPDYFDFFSGNGSKVDAVNVWNKELTASEVTALYNGASGLEYPFSTAITIDSANDSLDTYNGTAQGGLTYTAGKSGNAFTFNGTNAGVLFSNGAWNFIGNFSISMWVKFSSSGLSQILISNFTIGGTTTVSGWFIEKTLLELRFRGYNNGSLVLSATKSSFSPSTSVYTHLVFTRSSTNSKIYIDGVLDTTSTTTGAPNYESTNYPMIGVNKYDASNYQEFFNGSIDEVNLWNKELTSTEVTELYNASTGKFYPY